MRTVVIVGLLAAVSNAAHAACGDSASGGNGIVYASGNGSVCSATFGAYSGVNTGFATGSGATLTFTAPAVTVAGGGGGGSYVLAVGSANIGGTPVLPGATVTAVGDLTVTAASAANSRGVYIYGGADSAGQPNRLSVRGSLVVTRLAGSGGAAVQNQGGDIQVRGTTTVTSGSLDAFRNAGTGTFDGVAQITAAGVGTGILSSAGQLDFRRDLIVNSVSGAGINQSGGSIAVGGNTTVKTTGTGIAVAVSGGSFDTRAGLLTLDTQGAGAHGLSVSGVGKATIGVVGATTQGTAAHGLYASAGGQISSTGGVSIETKGDNARGVLATGLTSSVQLASTTVTTSGIDARGLSAASGGTLTVDGLADVTTTGQRGHAVLAGDTGTGNVGTVRIGSVRTQTSGSQGNGLYAINAGSRVDVTGDATLTVGGPSSIGIVAELGGVVAVGGKTTIDHSSADGYGILAQNSGSLVALQSADIQTAQAGRLGLYVADGASVTATRMDVRTTGATADGIVANGGSLSVSGPLNVNVAGSSTNVCNGGVAICVAGNKGSVSGGSASAGSLIEATGTVLRLQTGTDVTATFENATLRSTAAGGDLISVDQVGGASSLTLRNSTATAGVSKLLLNVATGSAFAFDNDRTTLTGDIKASADSTVNMTLTNGSFLTGRIDPVNLTIDASSRWDVTGDSVLGRLSHAGTLNMLPGAGGLGGKYKTVTVGNYIGNGGRINLNTYLGTDNSPSDKLVIDGGTASGSTTLGITNAGGGGAPTVGKGIQVVQATGGATTAASAFSLAAPVSAGAYDYSLVRNGDES